MFENLFSNGKTETEKELEEFRHRRQYERELFEAAMKDWLLKSGLAPIMMAQTRHYANECGLESWDESEQFDNWGLELDPRNPQHQEILEFVECSMDTDT